LQLENRGSIYITLTKRDCRLFYYFSGKQTAHLHSAKENHRTSGNSLMAKKIPVPVKWSGDIFINIKGLMTLVFL